MCKFCDSEQDDVSLSEMKIDCGDFGDFYVYTYIDYDKTLTTELYDVGKLIKKSVEINYCPMCGRELVEQE